MVLDVSRYAKSHVLNLNQSDSKVQLKRQHSAEPLNSNSRRSPASLGTNSVGATPPAESDPHGPSPPTLSNSVFGTGLPDEALIGSPMKRHRASLYDVDDTMQKRLGAKFGGGVDILAKAEAEHAQKPAAVHETTMDTEEEL